MLESCQVCGKKIACSFFEHIGKIGSSMSEDYGSDKVSMGGKCGSCGKLCCSDCYREGMCPPP